MNTIKSIEKIKISLDFSFIDRYTSQSQKIRVMTESWVDSEIFCPNCGTNVSHYENNRPVADFYCSNCNEDYELKSKKDPLGLKIVDGAYRTMVERLQSNKNPNFFLLNYNLTNYQVVNFIVIPKHFFIPEIIEKRKPLAETAQRAGWVGCNILLQGIPQAGKIFYIRDGQVESKQSILDGWHKTLFLREEKVVSEKEWIVDIMNCVDKLQKQEFFLDEIYSFEKTLKQKHPNNKHIKDKIRQQLQFLRDRGYLSFVHKGRYRLN